MIRGASKPLLIFAASTAALAGIGGYAWFESERPAVLEVYVFDTPGLPAIFMRTPDDKRILIGGGSNTDIVRRLTGVLPFYSRRLDMIIAPDTDARNVTGLIEVMNRYAVEKVMFPAVTLEGLGLAGTGDPAYTVLLETARSRAIPMEEFSAGTRPSFGSVTGDILFPVSPETFSYSKASPPGLCMRITYGSTSILIIGTATTKVQKFLVSATSTSPGFLQAPVLVTSRSSVSGNIADELMRAAGPDYLVYSQTIPKSAKKSSATAKKPDPLAGILHGHRFNVREKGIVKIVSDGHSVETKKEL